MNDAEKQQGGAQQPTQKGATKTAGNASTSNSDKETGSLRQSLTNILKGPVALLKNSQNPITLRNLILSAVMVGLEILLNEELFDCPLEGYKRYGWVFIFAPVPIMFCANAVIIRPHTRGQGLRWTSFKAMVGPGMWLVATFANSDYYVCATVGPNAGKRNLTDVSEIKELEKKIDAARGSSHLVAWLTFFLLAITGTVFIVKNNKNSVAPSPARDPNVENPGRVR